MIEGSALKDCNELKKQLIRDYGTRIICSVGISAVPEYNISSYANKEIADFAVYIHKQYQMAIIWNLARRRKHPVYNLSVSKKWDQFVGDEELIIAEYKRLGNVNEIVYEKVLIVPVEVLWKIRYELADYLQMNPFDTEYPEKLKNAEECLAVDVRERVSTERWKRDQKFRKSVLNAYSKCCAICRCKEEKLLQAAHIQSVESGGADTVDNGICLCANHHLMLDHNLIAIDFINRKLTYVADAVKDMAWYTEFENTYMGKLLEKRSN